MSGESECNKCKARYPSAPAGTLHKCGRCSGGMCSPVQSPDPSSPVSPLPETDRWWAQRWIDKATPGELAAMRELLA